MIPYFKKVNGSDLPITAVLLTLYPPMLNLLRTPWPLATLSAITPFGSVGEYDPLFLNNSVIPL